MDEIILIILPKVKDKESASFVMRLIISPLDISSKAIAGKLRAFLYVLNPSVLVSLLSIFKSIEFARPESSVPIKTPIKKYIIKYIIARLILELVIASTAAPFK